MSQLDQAGFLRSTAPSGASVGALVTAGTEDFRYEGGKTPIAQVVSAAGDTPLATPAAGKRLRVFWVSFIPSVDNVAANLVTVKVGTRSLYVGYAMAHWEVFDGLVDAPLVVNCATAEPVAINIHYQEI